MLQLCPERIHPRHLFAYFYHTLTTSMTSICCGLGNVRGKIYEVSHVCRHLVKKQAGLQINLPNLGRSWLFKLLSKNLVASWFYNTKTLPNLFQKYQSDLRNSFQLARDVPDSRSNYLYFLELKQTSKSLFQNFCNYQSYCFHSFSYYSVYIETLSWGIKQDWMWQS